MTIELIVQQLVQLFSNHSIAAIEANDLTLVKQLFNKNHRDELMQMEGYDTYYSKFRQYKEKLEDLQAVFPEPKKQINACMLLLKEVSESNINSEASFNMLDNYKAITLAHFTPAHWSDTQTEDFERKFTIIFEWKDYFLSYTNRNAPETNNDFMKLLQSVYGQKLPNAREQSQRNLVAQVISDYLQRNNLRGFFDKEELKCGDDFGEKIHQYCTAAFSFIQLIEETTLKQDNASTNWCKKEYDTFRSAPALQAYPIEDADKKRHYFILTDEPNYIKPANLPNAYKDWFDHINRVNYKLVARNNRKFRRRVHEIAQEIVERRKSLINALLSQ